MAVQTQGFPELVKVATATSGTGTMTLGSAETGYMGTSQLVDGAAYDYTIEDGNDKEAGRGIYTASGTTLTRAKVYRSVISGSEGTTKLTLSGSATVLIGLSGAREAARWQADQVHIAGLLVSKNTGGNTLDISAGSCFDPASGKIISYAGGSAVSAGTLGASQWNQVYLYDNAGTATIEVVNNAAPPSSVYLGNARQGGTNNGRWIGAFLTDGSSNIRAQNVVESALGQISVDWLFDPPLRPISNVTDTSYTAASLLAYGVPRYVATHGKFRTFSDPTSGSANVTIYLSMDGVNLHSIGHGYATAGMNYAIAHVIMPIERSTPSIYYKIAPSAHGWLDTLGYLAVR